MSELKNAPAQESRNATVTSKHEGKSEGAELEYSDNRYITAQLVSLQSAADDKGNRSNTTQLQAKASAFTGTSRLAQLKAASDLRQPDSRSNPVQREENKTGLPDQLKSGMESLSNLSLNDVKVHRNSDKPAQLHAHAFAQGTDIHLGPGQEKHLPHELGHVVQQKEGRVKPTVQLKGKVNVNDDAGLEKEADVLGTKALQLKSFSGFKASQTSSAPISSSSNTFQLAPKGGKKAVEDELTFENIYPEKENGNSDKEFSHVNKFSKENSRKEKREKQETSENLTAPEKGGEQGAKENLPASEKGEKQEAKENKQTPKNPAPEKINRRKDELWPKNEDGKDKEYSTDVIDEQKLDDDLWFKSSEGIEEVQSTEENLPAYDQGISSAFHVTTNERSAASILDRVDPRFHNPAGRFGGGFYVATDLKTSYAEVQAHEYDNFKKGGDPTKGLLSAVHIIEYTGAGTADLVDASSTDVLSDMVIKDPKKIEKKVREEAKDGIVFNSTKGSGKNIVLFKNYGVLKAKGGFTGAAEGFAKFKEENPLKEPNPSMEPNQSTEANMSTEANPSPPKE